MRLRFSGPADVDLVNLFMEGIERHGVAQAERYRERLRQSLELLRLNPRMGRSRPELGEGTRALVTGVHIIVYEVEADELLILRIRHHREDWLAD